MKILDRVRAALLRWGFVWDEVALVDVEREAYREWRAGRLHVHVHAFRVPTQPVYPQRAPGGVQ